MLKVLFLTPWYPSDKDAMSGLFVQKHVEAVRAQGVDVHVIHSLTLRDTWHQWKKLRREGWLPDVVQLNVIQKQGLLALWLKKRYGIPYVIIEHWSGYLPQNGSVKKHSWHTRFMQRICRHAAVVMPVSDHLAKAMQTLGFQAPKWQKINNVVDDFFYQNPRKPQSLPNLPKTLLHISCFDERAKNVKGLLRAAKMLSEKRQDWQLVLVGTGVDYQDIRAYAAELDIPQNMLRWTGEITPRQVAEEFDRADALVLPSNYENAPVVISESLAKGVPVVSTNVGGIPEMVSEECGILVSPGNDSQLVEALEHMLDHHQDYNTQRIRQQAEQYAFTAVGKQLKAIYEQTCKSAI